MKSVAIIGAGPGGLIAARKLLQSQQFSVTVFESGDHVGGSWAPDGIINPEMRTNQSKFIMSFSDLSWESLHQDRKPTPLYPKASQVFHYLNEYYHRFIPAEIIQFGTTVLSAKQVVQEAEGENQMWWLLRIQKRAKDGKLSEHDLSFDYLVAAPGVLREPKELRCLLSDIRSGVPILHSTKYRTLNDIMPDTTCKQPGKRKILVVGGSHSGSDIAALISLQISNAKYGTLTSHALRDTWKEAEVVHVTARDMFAFPAVVRDTEATTCAFQPIDSVLFDRSSRPADPPPSFTFGLVTPDKVKASRKRLRTIFNGNEGCVNVKQDDDLAPYGTLSDTYWQFMRAGRITQVRGMLKALETTTNQRNLTAVIQNHGASTSVRVDDVCAVVYATGFEAASSFSFLSEEAQNTLGFDASCSQAPIILDSSYLSQNAACPNFAMVGFSGAFWPLFEMQARAVVKAWTASKPAVETSAQNEQRTQLRTYYSDLRQAIRQKRQPEIPHNAFGDSVGIVEQAHRELNLEHFDLGSSETQGLVCASRYIDPGSEKTEAMKTLSAIQSLRRNARENGLLLARAVFHGLHGEWIAASKDKTGRLSIIRHEFHPRLPTHASFDWEYLSIRTANEEAKRCVYRYEEATDCMTLWSVRQDGFTAGECVGMFDFNSNLQENGKDTVVALLPGAGCGLGDAENGELYQFLFAGATLKQFTVADMASPASSGITMGLNFTSIGYQG